MHNSDTVHIQLQDAFILPTEEELKLIRKFEEIDKKQRAIIENNISSNRYYWVELGNIIYQIKLGGPINMQLRGIIAMLNSEVI